MEKILVVEDDHTIALGLGYSLEEAGYRVEICYNTSAAMRALEADEKPSLLLLDLSLPDGSGYDICARAKLLGDYPVIFLTARDEEISVVLGLDMGADDYITKPFRVRELLSRIKSVLRRYQREESGCSVFQIGPIRVNLQEAKVYKGEAPVDLTALEYRLLLTLIHNAGQVMTRNQLLENIWDVAGNFVNDNTLTVYMKRLRDKLEEDPSNPKLIQTVRGMGYRMGEAHDS